MPDNLLSPSNGLSKSLLDQITAEDGDVFSGNKYLHGDGTIHEGSLTLSGTATAADVQKGKTFYSGGSTAVKTGTLDAWTVVDLGVGQSFNVTRYSGYKSFTNSNFICETQGLDWTGGNYWTQGDVKARACHKLIKSYNASSGVLSARAEVTGGINGGNTLTVNVRTYLKYKP